MHYLDTAGTDQSGGAPLRILVAGPVFAAASAPDGLRRHRLLTAAAPLAATVRQDRPDLLLMTAGEADAALAALLAEPDFEAMPVLMVTQEGDAEAAGLLLGANLCILDAPLEGDALLAALATMAGPGRVSDAGNRFDSAARIEALKRDAERVAAALADMAAGRPADAARPVDAGRIRAHIKSRRLRDRFLAPDLFADPAWDMLLDLTAAALEGRRVSVSSLCIAAAVPTTTALRWIKLMVDRGHFERSSDPADARRAFIRLSPPTAAAMEACLDAVLNFPGQ
jgi:hypothetical protein